MGEGREGEREGGIGFASVEGKVYEYGREMMWMIWKGVNVWMKRGSMAVAKGWMREKR